MTDPQLEMARKMGSSIAGKQGGTNLNQGPSGLGELGGGETVKSEHSSHDEKMHNDGGAGRQIKSIGS